MAKNQFLGFLPVKNGRSPKSRSRCGPRVSGPKINEIFSYGLYSTRWEKKKIESETGWEREREREKDITRGAEIYRGGGTEMDQYHDSCISK